MHIPFRSSGSAWLIGSAVLYAVLTGFSPSFCSDTHASDNVLFSTAMDKYYKGDIPGALKNIRAYIKQNPSDIEARIWKGFIRLEVARGLREKDRERSERIAGSESYETWCLWNRTEETNDVKEEKEVEDDGEDILTGENKATGDNMVAREKPSGGVIRNVEGGSLKVKSLWYAAMAKAYWLSRRNPFSIHQAIYHWKTALTMDPNNVEALQIKGEMAVEELGEEDYASPKSREDFLADAQTFFKEELKVATKSRPEARMRALYWLALSRCKGSPQATVTTLRKFLTPADFESRDSIYVKNCSKLIEHGCAAK